MVLLGTKNYRRLIMAIQQTTYSKVRQQAFNKLVKYLDKYMVKKAQGYRTIVPKNGLNHYSIEASVDTIFGFSSLFTLYFKDLKVANFRYIPGYPNIAYILPDSGNKWIEYTEAGLEAIDGLDKTVESCLRTISGGIEDQRMKVNFRCDSNHLSIDNDPYNYGNDRYKRRDFASEVRNLKN